MCSDADTRHPVAQPVSIIARRDCRAALRAVTLANVHCRFTPILLVMALAAPAAAARLTGVTITPGEITVATDAPVAAATAFALAEPFRLVVDLPGSSAEPVAADGVASVARLRLAMFAPGVARLVIDLNGPLALVGAENRLGKLVLRLQRIDDAGFAALVRRGRRALPIALASAAGDGFDLPADMFNAAPRAAFGRPASDTRTAAPDLDAPLPVTPGPPPPAAQPVSPPHPPVVPRAGRKLPLVVIDAGHGGKDVGAISVDGGYEKDVTLAIARAAAAALRKSGRVRVKLTRDDDRFIPLGGRVSIARQARADLFISVHADSAPNADARGASVYTLSPVASDAVAARLAARENKADIIGGLNLGVETPEIGNILIDLSRRATNNVSVAFAETLQDELSSRVGFRGEFHHFAGFYVLKAPDVPSVLLETGYVTNADDAVVLFSDAGRRRIGEGIARAAERHLLGSAHASR